MTDLRGRRAHQRRKRLFNRIALLDQEQNPEPDVAIFALSRFFFRIAGAQIYSRQVFARANRLIPIGRTDRDCVFEVSAFHQSAIVPLDLGVSRFESAKGAGASPF